MMTMMTPFRRLLFPAAPELPDAPRPDAFYYDQDARGVLELARVLESTTDRLGVCHIRFELIYRYQQKTLSAGERTLALAAFRHRFPREYESGKSAA